jgi:hypothetical protein
MTFKTLLDYKYSPLPYTDYKESSTASVVETPISKEPLGDSVYVRKGTTEEGRLIEDLCTFIRNLGDTTPAMSPATCLGIVRLEEEKYAANVNSSTEDTQRASFHSQNGAVVVCLDDYLVPNQSWELTRQKRMALALSLSLTILQFFPTPWISTLWTWKDFSMVRGERSKIFVTKIFFSTSHNPDEGTSQFPPYETSPFWACFGEPVLTRLGCRLELAIGKRLSDLRQPQHLDNAGDLDMLDLCTTKDVVESGLVFQEARECYNNAVQACLTHQVMLPEGVKGLNSKHDNFQLDLEQFVVAPIRDFYTASWGQVT